MRVLDGALAVILISVAATGLVQCGSQKNKVANVEIFSFPENPIVITADVTDGNGKKSKAPWFDFTLKIKNGSDQSFTIVAIVAEISIQDTNGGISTKNYAGDPGMFNYTSDVLECAYGDFGTWAVTEDKFLQVTHSNPDCPNRAAGFRVDALPLPAGSSYRYKIKIQPLGYFIDDAGLPDDRFEKTKVFYTQ